MTVALLESAGATPAEKFSPQGCVPAIPLRGRGGVIRAFALVDPEDYAWASKLRWHLHKSANDRIGYAVRSLNEDGKVHTEFLHRRILGLERGDDRQGDHRNRDSLDNRRSNLRVASHAENGQNRTGHQGRTSRHRGVSWRKDRQLWTAQVFMDGKHNHLGYFDSEQEAADAAARFREHHMPYSTD